MFNRLKMYRRELSSKIYINSEMAQKYTRFVYDKRPSSSVSIKSSEEKV